MAKKKKRNAYLVWNTLKSEQYAVNLAHYVVDNEEVDLFVLRRQGNPTNKRRRSKVGIFQKKGVE